MLGYLSANSSCHFLGKHHFFCWITSVVVANMNENLVFESRNKDEYIAIDLEMVFPISQINFNLVAGH